LFGGWRFRDSRENNNSDFCHAHTTVYLRAQVGKFHTTDSGEVSHEAKGTRGVKPTTNNVEVESVDKEAENFIEGVD
jgi:hypothetical protein